MPRICFTLQQTLSLGEVYTAARTARIHLPFAAFILHLPQTISEMSVNYGAIPSAIADAMSVTFFYFYTLYQYIFQGKSYSSCTTFPKDTWARVQLFSLSLIFKLWSKPHYRSPTFQQDMIDNLSNVAIPGEPSILSSEKIVEVHK